MQKAICSVAALTPALLVLGNLHQVGRTEEVPQNVRVQQLYASLQEAVCHSDWNQALEVLSPLIANPDLTSNYRQELVYFRYQLENWRAAKSRFAHQPDCPVTIEFSSQIPQTSRRSPSPQHPSTSSVQLLYTSLQDAICTNNWERALVVIQPLIGSPEISPTYRQQLVHFRHQLEAWRAAQAQVTGINLCEAIATTAIPEQV